MLECLAFVGAVMRATLRTSGALFVRAAARPSSVVAAQVAHKQWTQDESSPLPDDEEFRARRLMYRAWRQGGAGRSQDMLGGQLYHLPVEAPPPTPRVPPRLVNDFTMASVTPIAKGGFGYVYAATNRHDGKRYALKLCRMTSSGQAPTNEAECLACLPSHASLVRYFGAWSEPQHTVRELRLAIASHSLVNTSHGAPRAFEMDGEECDESEESEEDESGGETDDGFYWALRDRSSRGTLVLQMELLEACTLQEILRLEMAGSAELAADAVRWKWLAGIASGLRVMHAHGWVHNDVKPSNVFCADDGSVKICDFGLASKYHSGTALGSHDAAVASRGDEEQPSHGTPMYMAPEREQMAHVGPQSDVFSLGVCAAEIHGGFRTAMERAKTLTALKKAAAREDAHDASSVFVHDARALVMQMLAAQPEARPDAASVESEAIGRVTALTHVSAS